MGTRWSKLRTEQYYSRNPKVARGEQRRLAQQRYRQAHADALQTARQIGQILRRRTSRAGDIEKLVTLIRSLVGDDYARALGRELSRRRAK